MSKPNISYIPRFSAELLGQLEPLGGEFCIRSVSRILNQETLFPPARGAMNSFINDPEIRQSVADTFTGVDNFPPMLQADKHAVEETVRYAMPEEKQSNNSTKAAILISPNALKVISGPIAAVAETLPRDSHRLPFGKTQYLAVGYRALYAGALTRYAVMSRTLKQYNALSAAIDPKLQERTRFLYNRYFGEDKVEDTAVQLQRISLALGGSVMLRAMATSIHDEGTSGVDPSTAVIGHSLKMYSLGIKTANPSDQKEASFALANALPPKEAALFFRFWFSK